MPEGRHPGKKDLSSHLSVAKMHEMYLEEHEPEVYASIKAGEEANPKVKYEYRRNYFNTHFDFSFGLPKTDTCARCDELYASIIS